MVSSTAVATFKLCETQTTTACPGPSTATIVTGASCTLNTANSTQSYFNVSDSNSTLALVFSNGAEQLKVALWCDETQTTPVYGPLEQNDGSYSTSVTYSKLCPVFTYNAFA